MLVHSETVIFLFYFHEGSIVLCKFVQNSPVGLNGLRLILQNQKEMPHMATKASSSTSFLIGKLGECFFFFLPIYHSWHNKSWVAVSSLDSHISLRLEAQFEQRWRNVLVKLTSVALNKASFFACQCVSMPQPDTDPKFHKQQFCHKYNSKWGASVLFPWKCPPF